MLAVMGSEHINQLSKKNLTYKNSNGEIFFDIDKYFKKKFYMQWHKAYFLVLKRNTLDKL